jgi:hypothetical protein
MIKNFNYFGVFISLVGLIVLFYDFFLNNEFGFEGNHVIAFAFVLILNSVRLFYSKLNTNIWFSVLFNLSLLALLVYNWSVLIVFWRGYGFTGREIPFIFYTYLLVHFAMIIFMMIEFVIFIKKREQK